MTLMYASHVDLSSSIYRTRGMRLTQPRLTGVKYTFRERLIDRIFEVPRGLAAAASARMAELVNILRETPSVGTQ